MMDPDLVIQQREAERVAMAENPETYNASDNSSKCYALAIRCIRLERIRLGLTAPNADDPEEMAVAKMHVATVMPVPHARSA